MGSRAGKNVGYHEFRARVRVRHVIRVRVRVTIAGSRCMHVINPLRVQGSYLGMAINGTRLLYTQGTTSYLGMAWPEPSAIGGF